MHRALTRTLAGACALSLLFAACSDDGGDDEADATTTTASEETTTTAAEEETSTTAAEDESTTTEADEPTDEGDPDAVALAEAINLTLADFGDGWEAEPPSDDDDEDESSLNNCFVETPIRDVAVGRAESDTFSIDASDTSGQLITMQTVVFDSPETAEAITAEAAGEAFVTCATDGLVGSFGEGAEGQLVLTPDEPPLTEESFALAGAVVIPSDAGPSQGLVDIHLFRTQNVVSFVATVDVGETGYFEDTITGVYQTVADRHAANVQ